MTENDNTCNNNETKITDKHTNTPQGYTIFLEQ